MRVRFGGDFSISTSASPSIQGAQVREQARPRACAACGSATGAQGHLRVEGEVAGAAVGLLEREDVLQELPLVLRHPGAQPRHPVARREVVLEQRGAAAVQPADEDQPPDRRRGGLLDAAAAGPAGGRARPARAAPAPRRTARRRAPRGCARPGAASSRPAPPGEPVADRPPPGGHRTPPPPDRRLRPAPPRKRSGSARRTAWALADPGGGEDVGQLHQVLPGAASAACGPASAARLAEPAGEQRVMLEAVAARQRQPLAPSAARPRRVEAPARALPAAARPGRSRAASAAAERPVPVEILEVHQVEVRVEAERPPAAVAADRGRAATGCAAWSGGSGRRSCAAGPAPGRAGSNGRLLARVVEDLEPDAGDHRRRRSPRGRPRGRDRPPGRRRRPRRCR